MKIESPFIATLEREREPGVMFPDIINLKKIVYTLKVRGGYIFLGGYGLAEKTIVLEYGFYATITSVKLSFWQTTSAIKV